MPFSINWLIKDEVIFVKYYGVTTPEELRACLLKMGELIESSPRYLVHAINDVGDITKTVALKDSVRIVREVGHHPRYGWTVAIREKSMLVKMGSAIGASIFKLRFRAFSTLDQAITHLKASDRELSWHKMDISVTS